MPRIKPSSLRRKDRRKRQRRSNVSGYQCEIPENLDQERALTGLCGASCSPVVSPPIRRSPERRRRRTQRSETWAVDSGAGSAVLGEGINGIQVGQAFDERWRKANDEWDRKHRANKFGIKCDVCGRLWSLSQIRQLIVDMTDLLVSEFPGSNTAWFQACRSCFRCLKGGKIPAMSHCQSNGYAYPPIPPDLPPLNPIEERLISPRIPFMQIRRLRRIGSYGIIGQVINVPVDSF